MFQTLILERSQYLYFNAVRRRITPCLRKLIRSSEFSCPPELTGGLEDFEKKVRSGQDITAHSSRSLKETAYNDNLLNDWGIHHFHLGQVLENDGFLSRTGPVLFALVTDTDFFEINVYQHGNWSNLDIVEIVHANWPDVIERYRLKGVVGLTVIPDSETVKNFRNMHMNTMLQMKDGTVYASLGGGYMTDGTSTEAVMDAGRHMRAIKAWEDWMRSNTDKLIDKLRGSGVDETKSLAVRLEMDGESVYIVCPEYNVRFDFKKNETGKPIVGSCHKLPRMRHWGMGRGNVG